MLFGVLFSSVQSRGRLRDVLSWRAILAELIRLPEISKTPSPRINKVISTLDCHITYIQLEGTNADVKCLCAA